MVAVRVLFDASHSAGSSSETGGWVLLTATTTESTFSPMSSNRVSEVGISNATVIGSFGCSSSPSSIAAPPPSCSAEDAVVGIDSAGARRTAVPVAATPAVDSTVTVAPSISPVSVTPLPSTAVSTARGSWMGAPDSCVTATSGVSVGASEEHAAQSRTTRATEVRSSRAVGLVPMRGETVAMFDLLRAMMK